MIAGLAGFTLLLAVTACLLVRFGKVWDDMRSVLLLIVMMFLAISATIDDVLIMRPGVGLALALGGLAFAVLVSEGLFRGMRLGLPALYRGPYYLILALFFVYPVALRPLLATPDSAMSHWALFGFSTVAGLAFLTLIPAIRRGGAYLKGNGSPWRWPLYPWSLFFFLGLGVCGRAYYLCVSLHNVEGFSSIFGPYFLVPFGFAIALLLLEAGLTSRREGVTRFALMMPLALVTLAMIGHRTDPVYERFLALFQQGLGVAPPAAALILAVGYYGYAAYRSVPMARGLAMASLAAMMVVGPTTIDPWTWSSPRPWPLLPIAMVQGWLALRGKQSWRAILASACLAAWVVAGPGQSWTGNQQYVAALHLAVFLPLFLGAIFRDDEWGEFLRQCGGVGLLLASMAAIAGEPHLAAVIPPAWLGAYPIFMAAIAAAYAILIGSRFFFLFPAAILAALVLMFGSKGYIQLRRQITGLDRITLGLASFLVAALISLWKSGVPQRWHKARGRDPLADPQPLAGPPGP